MGAKRVTKDNYLLNMTKEDAIKKMMLIEKHINALRAAGHHVSCVDNDTLVLECSDTRKHNNKVFDKAMNKQLNSIRLAGDYATRLSAFLGNEHYDYEIPLI